MTTAVNLTYVTSASPMRLILYAYQSGAYLSSFSGSYISDVSGSSLDDVGVSADYHNPPYAFSLTFNNNSHLSTGIDEYNEISISNYYLGLTLGNHSASTLGEMAPETLNELSVIYVG